MEKRKVGSVMKLNWKLRYKNKATLTALAGAVISLAYQIMGLVGITPAISESEVVQTAGMVINVLVLLGIVMDPTTKGMGDSDTAMTYEEPRQELETEADEDDESEAE